MDLNWTIILIETLAVTAIGSLLHFTYAWSGRNKFVAIFSAVNESTWEHVKLALSGFFACTLVDIWFLGDNPNYWIGRGLSFLTAVVVIPVLFYSYQVFTRRSVLPLDITIFVIAAFLGTLIFDLVLNMPPVGEAGGIVSVLASIVILAMYLLLTRFPIHHSFLFQDPITHRYGYEGHNAERYKKRKK